MYSCTIISYKKDYYMWSSMDNLNLYNFSFYWTMIIIYILPHGASAQTSNNPVLEAFDINGTYANVILRAHNTARSEVSPTAQNMREMTWDEELARLADQYSKLCLFQHNANRTHSRFQPPGENIFVSTNILFNQAYVEKAVGDWDAEKALYNFSTGRCEIQFPNQTCGHYTQVVWGDTFKVGCGASKCSTINVRGRQWIEPTIFICNYGPSGNIEGRRPYSQGQPCGECHSSDTCDNNLCVNPLRNNSIQDPSWLDWSPWSACCTTCGLIGLQRRQRICNTFHNSDCDGVSAETNYSCGVNILINRPSNNGDVATPGSAVSCFRNHHLSVLFLSGLLVLLSSYNST